MKPYSIGPALFLACFLLLSACSAPTYVDKGKNTKSFGSPFSEIVFHVHEAYEDDPPKCIAVLPFETSSDGKPDSQNITLSQTQSIRRAFYAHISPHGTRDVEIPRVDFLLSKLSRTQQKDLGLIGRTLDCDTLVFGQVFEHGSSYLGLYSRVAVGARLKMIRARDGAMLWEGEHVAASHGGDIPFSPIGIAAGLINAAMNLQEEILLEVIDALARRLVSTIPDSRVAVLEEPLSPPEVVIRKPSKDAKTVEDFLQGLENELDERQQSILVAAIRSNRFGDEGTASILQVLIEKAPDNPQYHSMHANYFINQGNYDGALSSAQKALSYNDKSHEMHFLIARVFIQRGKFEKADQAIVRAISVDDSQSRYFNTLGYVNSSRGNHDRALAAYEMAVDRDPSNGFAFYNMAVTLFNDENYREAANGFYAAAMAYFKQKRYGETEKALKNLKDLANNGIDVRENAELIEKALGGLAKGERNDV